MSGRSLRTVLSVVSLGVAVVFSVATSPARWSVEVEPVVVKNIALDDEVRMWPLTVRVDGSADTLAAFDEALIQWTFSGDTVAKGDPAEAVLYLLDAPLEGDELPEGATEINRVELVDLEDDPQDTYGSAGSSVILGEDTYFVWVAAEGTSFEADLTVDVQLRLEGKQPEGDFSADLTVE